MAVTVAALVVVAGCGEKDESPAAPSASDPVAVVQGAAEGTLRAGPSTARIQVKGGSSYAIEETLDLETRWYLVPTPQMSKGVLAVTRSPITGPAFDFGASDVNRAFVGPTRTGPKTCWIEAHAPAGRVRGTVSAEEAIVTAHTVLALLTRNVQQASPTDDGNGYRVRLAAPSFDDANSLTTPPNASVTRRHVKERERSGRRIVNGLRQPIEVTIDPAGTIESLSVEIRGGSSPLSFTGDRPAATVTLTFTGIGDGEPVEPPRCTGIE